MAMSGASPNSFLLKNPNPNRHLFNNPASTTTTHINVFPLNRSSRPNKPISITCSTSAQVQDRPATAAQSQDRVFNFAAGPAILPEIVLKKAESELYNWRGSGMSVMEMSHRGKEFLSIIQKAKADLRTLLDIPSDYAVLFLQGGATTQFAGVPLNLCKPSDPVDYIVTGSWGDKAFKEAAKYCKPTVIWSGKSEKYTKIPSFDELDQNPNARYLHICANETIHGVEFKNYPIPKNKNGLMVADMSSNFCSKPVDVTKFGVIYAGAQKNVGPSGVTIVIIRKDLIGNAQEITPVMLDFKIHAENNSLYNTPPCYGIYMCGLVFEDLLAQGGLTEVEKKNMKKAQILYDTIDQSNGFYRCPVDKSVRSLMNVPFTLEKPELEVEFVKEAAAEKMMQLKGHRSVGGMRASIYNAMPLAGVEKLVSFMNDFQEVEMEDIFGDPIMDIDSCDAKNPLAAVDYIDDLYAHYRTMESCSCVSSNYMSQQCDINKNMRAILIDWLIEVHHKFDLREETLFLTVNLVDRFLAQQTVVRKNLQLVNLVAMLLACKYEEVSFPVVDYLVFISDKAYSRTQVLEMERLMLNTLQLNMSVPTPYPFIKRYLKAAQSDRKVELLSFFLIELCLVEYEMLKFPPSFLAAAAVYTMWV